MTPVHPRVCGERPTDATAGRSTPGSSPRVRGTLDEAGLRPLATRFIPACAGNARYSRTREQTHPVHPRVCGERQAVTHDRATASGSSPRVRGTRTPTSLHDSRSPVHPRVCGERDDTHNMTVRVSGSSPRVRGTQSSRRRSFPTPRFIPACAGNAAMIRRPILNSAVHPRVCGERLSRKRATPGKVGSSPRVRGTRRGWCRSAPGFPVHPRVCGERQPPAHPVQELGGSSPRVRGTPRRLTLQPVGVRFIPACAGNAPFHQSGRQRQPVHPRVCGERHSEHGPELLAGGSSPRVRGTRGSS